MCSVMRVTRIAGFFFFLRGGGDLSSQVLTPFYGHLSYYRRRSSCFQQDIATSCTVCWCMFSSEKVLCDRKTEGVVGSSFSGLKPYDRVLLVGLKTI